MMTHEDIRLKAELLAEEQERAIEYLKSAPRKRIQELGRARHDVLLNNADSRSEKKKVRPRNLVHPKSLPRLKEESPLAGDLSLKAIIRN